MYTVKVGPGEGAIDRALRKLKTKVLEDGLMDELYRLRSYENPRDKAKRKERIKFKKLALKNKRVDKN
jgi:ribosomal protein S21